MPNRWEQFKRAGTQGATQFSGLGRLAVDPRKVMDVATGIGDAAVDIYDTIKRRLSQRMEPDDETIGRDAFVLGPGLMLPGGVGRGMAGARVAGDMELGAVGGAGRPRKAYAPETHEQIASRMAARGDSAEEIARVLTAYYTPQGERVTSGAVARMLAKNEPAAPPTTATAEVGSKERLAVTMSDDDKLIMKMWRQGTGPETIAGKLRERPGADPAQQLTPAQIRQRVEDIQHELDRGRDMSRRARDRASADMELLSDPRIEHMIWRAHKADGTAESIAGEVRTALGLSEQSNQVNPAAIRAKLNELMVSKKFRAGGLPIPQSGEGGWQTTVTPEREPTELENILTTLQAQTRKVSDAATDIERDDSLVNRFRFAPPQARDAAEPQRVKSEEDWRGLIETLKGIQALDPGYVPGERESISTEDRRGEPPPSRRRTIWDQFQRVAP